ncbi:MAG: hypothetical protein MZV63_25710, partial [Marinilabiliales bacterium]|nr:hypothetical protein [Marinilabiliales bacterium]
PGGPSLRLWLGICLLLPGPRGTGSGLRGADRAGSGRSTRSPGPAKYHERGLSPIFPSAAPPSRSGAALMVATRNSLPAARPPREGKPGNRRRTKRAAWRCPKIRKRYRVPGLRPSSGRRCR